MRGSRILLLLRYDNELFLLIFNSNARSRIGANPEST